MKYCVPYNKHFKYMKEVDEMIIPYTEEDIHFANNLVTRDYLHDKRIIISIDDETFESFAENKLYKVFIGLKTAHSYIDFVLRFDTYYRNGYDEIYNALKENNIPFFFATLAKDWDTFNGLCNLGVSDIYIVEELGFELNKLGPMAHAKSILIRTFANVSQTSWPTTPSIKTFFIRPEDVDIYEPYIDVLEFFGNNNKQEVMYRVYSKEKKWTGDLSEIIVGFNQNIDSNRLMPMFAARRLRCGKKCAKGETCHICDRFVDVSNTLKDKNLIFR